MTYYIMIAAIVLISLYSLLVGLSLVAVNTTYVAVTAAIVLSVYYFIKMS
jgi:hypothetical protein